MKFLQHMPSDALLEGKKVLFQNNAPSTGPDVAEMTELKKKYLHGSFEEFQKKQPERAKKLAKVLGDVMKLSNQDAANSGKEMQSEFANAKEAYKFLLSVDEGFTEVVFGDIEELEARENGTAGNLEELSKIVYTPAKSAEALFDDIKDDLAGRAPARFAQFKKDNEKAVMATKEELKAFPNNIKDDIAAIGKEAEAILTQENMNSMTATEMAQALSALTSWGKNLEQGRAHGEYKTAFIKFDHARLMRCLGSRKVLDIIKEKYPSDERILNHAYEGEVDSTFLVKLLEQQETPHSVGSALVSASLVDKVNFGDKSKRDKIQPLMENSKIQNITWNILKQHKGLEGKVLKNMYIITGSERLYVDDPELSGLTFKNVALVDHGENKKIYGQVLNGCQGNFLYGEFEPGGVYEATEPVDTYLDVPLGTETEPVIDTVVNTVDTKHSGGLEVCDYDTLDAEARASVLKTQRELVGVPEFVMLQNGQEVMVHNLVRDINGKVLYYEQDIEGKWVIDPETHMPKLTTKEKGHPINVKDWARMSTEREDFAFATLEGGVTIWDEHEHLGNAFKGINQILEQEIMKGSLFEGGLLGAVKALFAPNAKNRGFIKELDHMQAQMFGGKTEYYDPKTKTVKKIERHEFAERFAENYYPEMLRHAVAYQSVLDEFQHKNKNNVGDAKQFRVGNDAVRLAEYQKDDLGRDMSVIFSSMAMTGAAALLGLNPIVAGGLAVTALAAIPLTWFRTKMGERMAKMQGKNVTLEAFTGMVYTDVVNAAHADRERVYGSAMYMARGPEWLNETAPSGEEISTRYTVLEHQIEDLNDMMVTMSPLLHKEVDHMVRKSEKRKGKGIEGKGRTRRGKLDTLRADSYRGFEKILSPDRRELKGIMEEIRVLMADFPVRKPNEKVSDYYARVEKRRDTWMIKFQQVAALRKRAYDILDHEHEEDFGTLINRNTGDVQQVRLGGRGKNEIYAVWNAEEGRFTLARGKGRGNRLYDRSGEKRAGFGLSATTLESIVDVSERNHYESLLAALNEIATKEYPEGQEHVKQEDMADAVAEIMVVGQMKNVNRAMKRRRKQAERYAKKMGLDESSFGMDVTRKGIKLTTEQLLVNKDVPKWKLKGRGFDAFGRLAGMQELSGDNRRYALEARQQMDMYAFAKLMEDAEVTRDEKGNILTDLNDVQRMQKAAKFSYVEQFYRTYRDVTVEEIAELNEQLESAKIKIDTPADYFVYHVTKAYPATQAVKEKLKAYFNERNNIEVRLDKNGAMLSKPVDEQMQTTVEKFLGEYDAGAKKFKTHDDIKEWFSAISAHHMAGGETYSEYLYKVNVEQLGGELEKDYDKRYKGIDKNGEIVFGGDFNALLDDKVYGDLSGEELKEAKKEEVIKYLDAKENKAVMALVLDRLSRTMNLHVDKNTFLADAVLNGVIVDGAADVYANLDPGQEVPVFSEGGADFKGLLMQLEGVKFDYINDQGRTVSVTTNMAVGLHADCTNLTIFLPERDESGAIIPYQSRKITDAKIDGSQISSGRTYGRAPIVLPIGKPVPGDGRLVGDKIQTMGEDPSTWLPKPE